MLRLRTAEYKGFKMWGRQAHAWGCATSCKWQQDASAQQVLTARHTLESVCLRGCATREVWWTITSRESEHSHTRTCVRHHQNSHLLHGVDQAQQVSQAWSRIDTLRCRLCLLSIFMHVCAIMLRRRRHLCI